VLGQLPTICPARRGVSEADHGHLLLTTRSQMVGGCAGERDYRIDKYEIGGGLLFLLRVHASNLVHQLFKEFNPSRYGTPPTPKRGLSVVACWTVTLWNFDHDGAYIADNRANRLVKYIQLYRLKNAAACLNRRSSQADETKGKLAQSRNRAVTFDCAL